MNRAVFLDRDGTVIEEKDFLHLPEEVELYSCTGAALLQLRSAGFKLFIVSNQSGVGRGYFTMEDVEKANARMLSDLSREGVSIEQIYIAPEAPDMPSRGRKPSPQFLFDARDAFSLDLGQSYMIGDRLSDLECGWNAGVKKCLMVRTGYGAGVEKESAAKLHRAVIVDDLGAAASWILADAESTPLSTLPGRSF